MSSVMIPLLRRHNAIITWDQGIERDEADTSASKEAPYTSVIVASQGLITTAVKERLRRLDQLTPSVRTSIYSPNVQYFTRVRRTVPRAVYTVYTSRHKYVLVRTYVSRTVYILL